MNIFEIKDRLGRIADNLAAIEQRVIPSVATRPVRYFPRARPVPGTRLGSPGWLETLINDWVGPLTGLWTMLQEMGILSPGQAATSLTKAELLELIKGMVEEKKPWYKQPWTLWLICGIAGVGSITAVAIYYLAKKPKK